MSNLGVRIKARRKQLKLTQEELAGKINASRSSISQWESGNTSNLLAENFFQLAKALDVTHDWLYYGKELDAKQKESQVVITPIQKSDKVTTFIESTKQESSDFKQMTPDTIQIAYRLNSHNLVTAIYKLMNLSKQHQKIQELREISDLINAAIALEEQKVKSAEFSQTQKI